MSSEPIQKFLPSPACLLPTKTKSYWVVTKCNAHSFFLWYPAKRQTRWNWKHSPNSDSRGNIAKTKIKAGTMLFLARPAEMSRNKVMSAAHPLYCGQPCFPTLLHYHQIKQDFSLLLSWTKLKTELKSRAFGVTRCYMKVSVVHTSCFFSPKKQKHGHETFLKSIRSWNVHFVLKH